MTNARLRRGRHSELGAWYAITTVSHGRLPLFTQPALSAAVIAEIGQAADAGWLQSYAWVLMPDHVHWLFVLRRGDLSGCVQAFKSRAAHAVNRLQGRHGPVWQPGFYDHRLRDDDDLHAQARYIVANPLRSGLVARIEDYPYWHYPWIAGQGEL